jgi:predicted ester cyclase
VQLVLEFFARVWHPPHDLSAIDELMTEDYVITSAGRGHQGREAFKAWVRQFQSQLLNVTTESVDAFPSPTGDRVVPRWVCSGQHNGLLSLPPTHRPIAFTGIAIWRVQDGKLAECWAERSAWELYQKLTS